MGPRVERWPDPCCATGGPETGERSMRSRIYAVLTGLAVMLPAAVAFAQKAPPGDVGSSAPEPSMLLLAAIATVPMLLLRKGR